MKQLKRHTFRAEHMKREKTYELKTFIKKFKNVFFRNRGLRDVILNRAQCRKVDRNVENDDPGEVVYRGRALLHITLHFCQMPKLFVYF